MNQIELGTILKKLSKNYPGFAPDEDEVERWWQNFASLPTERMMLAAKAYVDAEQYPPTCAKFREYLSMIGRAEARTAAPSRCEDCEGTGWKESSRRETAVASRPSETAPGRLDGPPEAYEFTYAAAMYPCPECRRDSYDRWRSTWVPDAIRARPIGPDTKFTYNPTAKVAEVKRMLAGAASKDTSTL